MYFVVSLTFKSTMPARFFFFNILLINCFFSNWSNDWPALKAIAETEDCSQVTSRSGRSSRGTDAFTLGFAVDESAQSNLFSVCFPTKGTAEFDDEGGNTTASLSSSFSFPFENS